MNKIGCVQHDCDECARREAEFAALRAENEEQARLLGIGGSREARLIAEMDRLKKYALELDDWNDKLQAERDEYRAALVDVQYVAKGQAVWNGTGYTFRYPFERLYLGAKAALAKYPREDEVEQARRMT